MDVYLDNAASTRVDDSVFEAMKPYFTKEYGNPSSIHSVGERAKRAVEDSREVIAKKISANPNEIFFTSGGTESNNLALKGVAFANKGRGKHIITSKVEHSCVLESCRWLETQGFEVTYLDVDKYGLVHPQVLEDAIRDDTILASIIHGNNEVGTINDIKDLAGVCRERGVLFHTDACQSFTKTDLDVEGMGLDLATINSHKIHGPKGVGALYVRGGVNIMPWQHGGGHEGRIRSGTLNVCGIVGFGKAVEVSSPKDVESMTDLRDRLISGLLEIPDTFLNGHPERRLCNNASVGFRHIEGEGILMHLDDRGIQVSTGSACSSKSLEPSYILTAMGLKPEDSHGTIRFSLSKYTRVEEIEYTVKSVGEVVGILRKMSPFGGG
ncbi:MAG TPA: cysteine desulfurase [Candidatus Altiarchaeales archaeon]|nr:cysteine desulfurase [Candidatus Altiarchaeales archaeon]